MGDRKELMNELYDASLITLGAVAVSMVSKKFAGDNLGIPAGVKGILKLAVAVGASSLLVKYLQSEKLIPDDPFK